MSRSLGNRVIALATWLLALLGTVSNDARHWSNLTSLALRMTAKEDHDQAGC